MPRDAATAGSHGPERRPRLGPHMPYLRHTGVMATTKVTITLDDEVLTRVRAARAEEIERRWGPFSPKAMAWARRAAGVAAEPGDAAYLAEIDAERAARRPAASA